MNKGTDKSMTEGLRKLLKMDPTTNGRYEMGDRTDKGLTHEMIVQCQFHIWSKR